MTFKLFPDNRHISRYIFFWHGCSFSGNTGIFKRCGPGCNKTGGLQKRREGGARGGGGRPSNVLQDHFSNSSNSGVKIADDLGNCNVYEYRFLQSCHFNSILPRSVQHFSCRSTQIPVLPTPHVLYMSSR